MELKMRLKSGRGVGRWLGLILLSVALLLLSRCRSVTPAVTDETSAKSGGSAVVLMYHHLLPEDKVGSLSGNRIVTTVEAFTKQLDYLSAAGFTTITPKQLTDFLYDGKPLPNKAVLITFDDGYLSNAVYAYPLLKERGMTATVFSVTGKTGEVGQTMNPAQVQMMDLDTMKQVSDVLVFASHTNHLHEVAGSGQSTLTAADGDKVRQDLAASFDILKTIPNADLTAFSYPYGLMNDTVKTALKEAGVKIAFRASEGVVTADSDPYALPRFPVDFTVSMDEFRQFFSGIS